MRLPLYVVRIGRNTLAWHSDAGRLGYQRVEKIVMAMHSDELVDGDLDVGEDEAVVKVWGNHFGPEYGTVETVGPGVLHGSMVQQLAALADGLLWDGMRVALEGYGEVLAHGVRGVDEVHVPEVVSRIRSPGAHANAKPGGGADTPMSEEEVLDAVEAGWERAGGPSWTSEERAAVRQRARAAARGEEGQ